MKHALLALSILLAAMPAAAELLPDPGFLCPAS